MSGRHYDTSKFGENKVEHFEWEDHHSPALHILFEACMKMHAFLKSKINRHTISSELILSIFR